MEKRLREGRNRKKRKWEKVWDVVVGMIGKDEIDKFEFRWKWWGGKKVHKWIRVVII